MATRLTLDSNGLKLGIGNLLREASSLLLAVNLWISNRGRLETRRGYKGYNLTTSGGGATTIQHKAYAVRDTASTTADSILLFSAFNGDRETYNCSIGFAQPNPASSRFEYSSVSTANTLVCQYRRPTVMKGLRRPLAVTAWETIEVSGATNAWSAGVEPMLIPTSTTLVAPTGAGMLSNNTKTSYRATILYRELTAGSSAGDNIQEFEGAASQPCIVANTSGSAKDVTLRFPVPRELRSYVLDNGASPPGSPLNLNKYKIYLRVYRSIASVPTTDAGFQEDYRLVYEKRIESADVTAQYIEFTDIVPDAGAEGGLMGVPLYQSANIGDGATAGNYPAPGGFHSAVFGQRGWIAGPIRESYIIFRLVGLGAPNGLQAGDTISIFENRNGGTAACNLTAGTSFAIASSGTLTNDIRDTVVNICRAINLLTFTGGTDEQIGIYAEPLNASASTPETVGAFRVWFNTMYATQGAGATNASLYNFLAQTSRPGALQITPHANIREDNAICWSQPNNPLAWRLPDQTYIGSNANQILALCPLDDAMFILTLEGVYRLTNPDFPQIELFDATVRVVGNDAWCIANGAIYAWCRDRVVRITNGGVQDIGANIQPYLREVNWVYARLPDSNTFLFKSWEEEENVVRSEMFAMALEEERKVLFFWPDSYASGVDFRGCSRALVYNIDTDAWTQQLSPGVENPESVFGHGEWSTAIGMPLWVLGGDWYNSAPYANQIISWQPFNSASDYQDDCAFLDSVTDYKSEWQYTAQLGESAQVQRWKEVQVFLYTEDCTLTPNPFSDPNDYGSPPTVYPELVVQFWTDEQGMGETPAAEVIAQLPPDGDTTQPVWPPIYRIQVPNEVALAGRLRMKFASQEFEKPLSIEGIAVIYDKGDETMSRVRN